MKLTWGRSSSAWDHGSLVSPEHIGIHQVLEVQNAGVLDAAETPYDHRDRVPSLHEHGDEVPQLTRVATLGAVEWGAVTGQKDVHLRQWCPCRLNEN